MNTTNSEYFTFNVDSSLLLVGQTGTGKSVLEDKYIERLLNSYTSDKLQFILLDMTGVDFHQLRDNYKEYVQEDVLFDSNKGLDILEATAQLSEDRAASNIKEPMIVLLIEECDMAAANQVLFDSLLIRINNVASAANMKVIYSTSRPSSDVVSLNLIKCFDLILAGILVEADYKHLGVEQPPKHMPYDFIVTQKNENLALKA